MKEYFILFSNCITVQGASRAIICDLQWSRYKTIPLLLHGILEKSRILSVSELKNEFKTEKGLDKYLKVLVDEDWGFFTSEPNNFPKLERIWHSNTSLSNAIISINKEFKLPFKKINSELSDLECQALQLRLFGKFSLKCLTKIISNFKNNSLIHIEGLIEYSENLIDEKSIKNLISVDNRVKTIIVHSAPEENEVQFRFETIGSCHVLFTKKIIVDGSCCGDIGEKSFSLNMHSFMESQEHNSCLNRKISITEEGEIKICPDMPFSYGNIVKDNIGDIISKSEFQKWWKIKKDDISICKDCEFRYICTDCRIMNFEDDKILNKPVKCNYDPYEAKWL